MWDLPGPGLEPVSPASAGGFLTTVPPGKPPSVCFGSSHAVSLPQQLLSSRQGQSGNACTKMHAQLSTQRRTTETRVGVTLPGQTLYRCAGLYLLLLKSGLRKFLFCLEILRNHLKGYFTKQPFKGVGASLKGSEAARVTVQPGAASLCAEEQMTFFLLK